MIAFIHAAMPLIDACMITLAVLVEVIHWTPELPWHD